MFDRFPPRFNDRMPTQLIGGIAMIHVIAGYGSVGFQKVRPENYYSCFGSYEHPGEEWERTYIPYDKVDVKTARKQFAVYAAAMILSHRGPHV